jgi:phosphopantothenoylcysteine decarboxylase/phosphopantothenate--cysteine ligase
MSARRLHVLVSAGPTREYIDPVRFLSNESSGRMGFAVAAAARAAGHRVTLVAGPVQLDTPAGVKRVDVVSAREMQAACVKAFAEADAVIMTAAVADYRPRKRLAGKWRAKDARSGRASIELVENPDILARLGRSKARGRGRKAPRTVIGFALETGSGRARALAKLHAKRADWIVLNDASALNAERSSATILAPDGSSLRIERRSKRDIARALIALL